MVWNLYSNKFEVDVEVCLSYFFLAFLSIFSHSFSSSCFPFLSVFLSVCLSFFLSSFLFSLLYFLSSFFLFEFFLPSLFLALFSIHFPPSFLTFPRLLFFLLVPVNCCYRRSCWCCCGCCYMFVYVTLHHERSRNVPDGHFHVFIFSASKFYAIYNGENHFKIRGLVTELHVFE